MDCGVSVGQDQADGRVTPPSRGLEDPIDFGERAL